ncbi:MAG TPA: heme-binding domain-containing protein [Candidatus Limnocylindrales bacterium]|nr:heme-binding domain-containing protein [Candidatus Limnocylindrales bacterium]
MMRRWVLIGLAVVVVIIGALVLVGSVAVAHSNPEVTHTIAWDSPQTEQLVRAACFDCHSNETVWPWYSYVAPMAFLVSHDVDEGRAEMNLSTGRGVEGDEMVEQIRRGLMPPQSYVVLHPSAGLTDAQKTQIIDGITATFGG